MLTIDPINGTLTWGEMTLDGTLRRADFINRHPAISLVHPSPPVAGVQWFEYQLPALILDGRNATAQVRFANERMVNVSIREAFDILSEDELAIDLENIEMPSVEEIQADMEQWAVDILLWLNSVRGLLREQLGEPHSTSSGSFPEMQYLSEQRQQTFDNWRYEFLWGDVFFTNEFLNSNQKLIVNYPFTRYLSWDDLLEEAECRQAVATHAADGYLDYYPLTIELIRNLSAQAPFDELNPGVSFIGLGFRHHTLATNILVEVVPGYPGWYRISRSDYGGKHTVYEDKLLETLRTFVNEENIDFEGLVQPRFDATRMRQFTERLAKAHDEFLERLQKGEQVNPLDMLNIDFGRDNEGEANL